MVYIPLSDPCSVATLTDDSSCIQCYSGPEKDIVKIWAMAQLLKLLGGTDVTDVDDLVDTVKCYKCESDLTLKGFEAAIWLNAAAELGLAPLTELQFSEVIKCWKCLDQKTVKAAHTLLLCKIAQLTSARQVA